MFTSGDGVLGMTGCFRDGDPDVASSELYWFRLFRELAILTVD